MALKRCEVVARGESGEAVAAMPAAGRVIAFLQEPQRRGVVAELQQKQRWVGTMKRGTVRM